MDTGKEVQLSQLERGEIKRNLWLASEHVYNGESVAIAVPDYDLGRSLVMGEHAILKETIEEMIGHWGQDTLNAGEVEFLIADFTKYKDPKALMKGVMAKIPNIWEIHGGPKRFSDYYPGTIVAFIGPDTIPKGIHLQGIGKIAKSAPSVFIQREGVDYQETNFSFFQAVGAHSAGLYRALKEDLQNTRTS